MKKYEQHGNGEHVHLGRSLGHAGGTLSVSLLEAGLDRGGGGHLANLGVHKAGEERLGLLLHHD